MCSRNYLHFITLLFFVGLMSSGQINAQPVAFKRVSPPEGTIFGLVNSMSQDSAGYLWLATFGHGLHRYDGYRFSTFLHVSQKNTSLSSNYLETVCAGRDGLIWVGTADSGLECLDPQSGIFTHYRHQSNDSFSLSDDRVTKILEDHEGKIWVGTKNGLNRLDRKTGKFTQFYYDRNDPGSLSNNRVRVIYEDRAHTLWVGTSVSINDSLSEIKGGLNKFERLTGKFTRYLHDPKNKSSLFNDRIGAILEDTRKNFWILTAAGGLHTMDRDKGIFERHLYDPANPEKLSIPPGKQIHPDLNLFFVCEDGAGMIWIGSSGGWITRYNPETKKTRHYDSFNDGTQAMRTLSGAMRTQEGMLWIRTWFGNIYKIDPFQSNIRHVFLGKICHSIYEDTKGVLWITSFERGLTQVYPSKDAGLQSDSPQVKFFADSNVRAIYEENDNIIWIGSGNQLVRHDRKTRQSTTYTNDPQNQHSLTRGTVTSIAGTRPGHLWIGTSRGLDLFDTRKRVFYHYRNSQTDPNSLGNNSIGKMMKDHAGNLWIVNGSRFLDVLDTHTGKFKHFSFDGAIGNMVEDFTNTIWIGTTTGLYRSNPEYNSFSRFGDLRIMMTPTTVITGIVEDNQKNLWVGSTSGIFTLDARRTNVRVLKTAEGVDPSGLGYVHMNGVKGKDGKLYFADKTGYYCFLPEQFKINPAPPKIVLSEFRLVDRRVMPFANDSNNFALNKEKDIKLTYNQHTFSFEFTGIHYSNPADNQQFYLLENLESDWRKVGVEKRVSYYNVPPGRYNFKMKVASRDGVWAEKNMAIIITPPWWTNWWIRVAGGIIVLGFLTVFIRWQLSRQFKQRLVNSEKEKQLADLRLKTGELKMQALRAQMNPHFIFNSLNSVHGYILEQDKVQASQYLTKFSRLIRLILHNSSASFIPLNKELEALNLYLELEALRFDNHFEYTITVDDKIDTRSIQVPPLIIQPYVENAIWHGLMHKHDKGHICIEVSQEEGNLFCKIIDDGIGRKNAAEIKARKGITYESMGMKITSERIITMQENNKSDNQVQITDFILPDGRPGGTEVLLKIPFL